MQSFRRLIAVAHNHCAGIRSFSTSDSASLRKNVASLLDSLSVKPGGALVHNCGDSEIGKVVIQLAKERKLQTISIIEDKPGTPDTIEELKALGGDIVVPESYTKTWYMKRLANELNPSAGLNFSDGYQATAVCKAGARKPIEWSAFLNGEETESSGHIHKGSKVLLHECKSILLLKRQCSIVGSNANKSSLSNNEITLTNYRDIPCVFRKNTIRITRKIPIIVVI
ncbi:hypothetical protein F0562_034291 [Nyssa sinensis]|uniref:Alcohol dehydrogenase-like C-terminal domain-containing protein n=1 Tax=Nyssa sinensis TaxID=561372 RepID=A0A5J5AHA7_9ASTE|nr:hypothetical protein F0562_034291 [Nyssa sinensis]